MRDTSFTQTKEHRERGRQTALKNKIWIKGSIARQSPEARAKFAAMMKGHPPYNWAGERPIYSTLHRWIAKKYGSANLFPCQNLKCPGQTQRTEWALIHGREYVRDVNNFIKLCVGCHRRYDRGLIEPHIGENQIS